jgi:hypothetical protein
LFLAVAVPEFPAFVAGQHVEFEWVPVEDVDAEFRYETVRAWPVGAEPHVWMGVSDTSAWDIGAGFTSAPGRFGPDEQA